MFCDSEEKLQFIYLPSSDSHIAFFASDGSDQWK